MDNVVYTLELTSAEREELYKMILRAWYEDDSRNDLPAIESLYQKISVL